MFPRSKTHYGQKFVINLFKFFSSRCSSKRPQKRYPYIIVKLSEGSRRIVVINGVSYYESTGKNSGYEKIFFPFMYLNGTKPNYLDHLPYYLLKKEIAACIYTKPEYFMKLDTNYFVNKPYLFNGIDPDIDEFAGRLPTVEAIVTSARLSGRIFPREKLSLVNLTPVQKQLSQQPIQLEEKPVFETTDSDVVNKWIMSQGASIARAVLTSREEKQASFFSNVINEKTAEVENELFGEMQVLARH
jgi:hypothetical protein